MLRTACVFPVLAALALATAEQSVAQSLLDRPPNLTGGWVGAPGTIYFNFLHRFSVGPAPTRQVSNSPTFLLGYTPFDNTLVGANYATRSVVAPSFPNEWEFFARYGVLRQALGMPLDVSLQAGYNLAAESFDGELSLGRQIGPLTLLGSGRVFTNAFASNERRFGVGGGATLRLLRWLALAGDATAVLEGMDTDDLAWGAGLHLAIPYTPHTLSLQASNTNTGTLQGSSVSMDDVRWGFEFTIPFTIARYFGRREAPPITAQAPDTANAAAVAAASGGDVVNASLKNLQFLPRELTVKSGTTVVWKNDDQVPHTVTAVDGSWTSPLMNPGQSYSRTFHQPGRHEILCTPHPFMRVVVEVTP